MAVIEQKYRVGIKDININGVISNRGIIGLLEDVACRHSDMAGFGINDIPETRASWVLLNWKIKVLKRIAYGTTVAVKTWSQVPGKLYTYRDFEMYDESNNLICIASSKWVIINVDTGSVSRIPEKVSIVYEPETKTVFDVIDIPKIKEPLNSEKTYTFTVQRRDIDINNHMHNLYYLDYAYEALPQEIYTKKTFNNIEIMYKTSAKLGNSIDCFYKEENGSHYIIMKNIDTNCLYSIIKLAE